MQTVMTKILKWITQLQQFADTIEYTPGESHHADGVSHVQIAALAITEATFLSTSVNQLATTMTVTIAVRT